MNPLQWFEPNLHPAVVHFAIALIVTAALCFVVSVRAGNADRQRSLRHAADWMLGLGSIAIGASVAAGFEAYYTVAHDGPSHAAMTIHRNWALASLILVLGISAWRWQQRKQSASTPFVAAVLSVAVLVSVTAWHGGALVFQHGLGVASLPTVSGEGHDHHDSGDTEAHDHAEVAASTTKQVSESDSHANHDHGASVGQATAPSEALSAVAEEAVAVADAFAKALDNGDIEALRELTIEAFLVGEGGGLERSFDEYASHHLPADIAFTKEISATAIDRQVIAGDQLVTVITQSQLHGRFRDETVHSQLLETLVVNRIDDEWRIAHVHWSSAPIDGPHEH